MIQYWSTSDTITTGLTDDSGNGHDGTLTGDGPVAFDPIFRNL